MFLAHAYNLLQKKKKKEKRRRDREQQNTLIRKKGNLHITFLKYVKKNMLFLQDEEILAEEDEVNYLKKKFT